MTTTLRPLTPEQPTPDGGKGRLFAVCVNGRPVGRVTATVHGGPGPRVGAITALGIDPPDRGRGRGTIAALAAEEVLRGWGCARVDVEIAEQPGEDPDRVLRFAGALGYTARSRNMLKVLPDSLPQLPSGTHGRPMTAEEFPGWLAAESQDYAELQIRNGLSPEQARARSDADHRRVLPFGMASPNTLLRRLEAAGQAVGSVWLNTDVGRSPDRLQLGWVFDVRVDQAQRGRGYGRALMLLAERECLDVGLRRLGLNVFVDNAPADALYRSLGYRTFRHVLYKQL
ncbi:GNAT family N-acetyltransferase [Streptacidiphilus sp. PB12-B1b]|uniref:GNAT family N-acetyltransferase n=1 Tax=Streptacidiphilus sp. PB12-B1b TaxID=2705012 RepID=UPI0015FB365F|nr:GNAT family N-acetyltransferase [Streptacidiphilus sp. PB12-B1b]QMU76380.1 GNAT family N-acetyltransferase [Streptacidiphilus sp. PB12-B1b]